MSDDLLTQIYDTASSAIVLDVTCGHTREPYKKVTYSVVDQKIVNDLQKQFDVLIDENSIKITDEQAREISSELKKQLVDSGLYLLLKQNQELVLGMESYTKNIGKLPHMNSRTKEFLSLYYSSLQHPNELNVFLQEVDRSDAAVKDDGSDIDERDLGGSRRKRSRRRKNGSKKSMKRNKKKTRARQSQKKGRKLSRRRRITRKRIL